MDPNPDRPYRFSIQGGPFGDVEQLRAHARHVEALGYEELFTADHVGTRHGFDPFAPLLIVAEATGRLRVGPLVLNNEFHNPGLLARTAATVDRLTNGRLVLGLGTGYATAEHTAIGEAIREPGPRVSRFEESLVVLRALLDEGSASREGEHGSVSIDDLGVRPLQEHVPFLIGGHGRRVVRLAARHADIFQFTGLTHAEDGAPEPGGFALADLAERAGWLDDAAGDRNVEIERSALVQFCTCGPDGPTADQLADRFGLTPAVVDESPFVLSGSLEQLVDKIGRVRELLGISHFVVRDPDSFAPVVDALATP